ncbi:MAG: hypothetical protein JWN32_50, partial [Solirubrobacterales bacterium]|nr:hypothetical protein [Solirubrobacterales bacterium]
SNEQRRDAAAAAAAAAAETVERPAPTTELPAPAPPDWGFEEPETEPARTLEIAFLTTVLPEGRTTGGEVVSQAFVDALRGAGHRVRVVGYVRPGGTVGDPDALSAGAPPTEGSLRDRGAWAGAALRRQLPYSVAKYASPAYAARAHALLTDPKVDLVILDAVQTGWLEPELRRATKPVVFLAHAATETSRRNGGGWSAPRRVLDREARLVAELERSLAALAVDVWTIEPDAPARLGTHARVLAVPGGIDVSTNGSRPAAAFDVGLIGSWAQVSNADGLRWFVDRVLPLLPPQASVHLAGRGADAFAGTRPGITVRGFVPDAAAFDAGARVLAVPAVVGGGLQVRTLDAIAAGGWVVATPLALRGIEAPPSTVGVAQDPDGFAAQITAGLMIPPDLETRAGALMWAQARRDAFRAAVAEAVQRAVPQRPTDPEPDVVIA